MSLGGESRRTEGVARDRSAHAEGGWRRRCLGKSGSTSPCSNRCAALQGPARVHAVDLRCRRGRHRSDRGEAPASRRVTVPMRRWLPAVGGFCAGANTVRRRRPQPTARPRRQPWGGTSPTRPSAPSRQARRPAAILHHAGDADSVRRAVKAHVTACPNWDYVQQVAEWKKKSRTTYSKLFSQYRCRRTM